MECPNCKAEAERSEIGGVDYIECEKCGWFAINGAGECEPCDPPGEPSDDAGGSRTSSPPIPKPITSSSSEKPNGAGAPPAPAGDSGMFEIEIGFAEDDEE